MKKFVQHAAIMLALTAVCQTKIASAEDFRWVSGGSRSASLVGDEKTVEQGCFSCGQAAGCEESYGTCCPYLGCEACPPRGIVGFAGFDSFKGISDGSYQSNFGALAGLNAAIPALGLRDYGIGWQLGMSYGLYDFDGRTTVNTATSQQQVFVTTGFFRKAYEDQQLSFGIVYDWMVNNNWGLFATTPTLGQWRGQFEWAFSGSNAVGVWGCLQDLSSQQVALQEVAVRTRPISQVNFFWHHKFAESNADSYLWVGATQRDRLSGDASLGDWIVGARVEVPLSYRMALYGNAQYMHPSAAASAVASVESGYNVGMGIMWYFGGHARSDHINGKCWLPYMPVANNSTFMVDQYSVL